MNSDPLYLPLDAKGCLEDREAREQNLEVRYYERRDGSCICPTCGKTLSRHGVDTDYLDYMDRPFLLIGCDGVRLKL